MRYEGEIKGKAKQAKGAVKETVGKTLDDRELRDEGKREKVEGRIKERMSKAKRVFGEAVEDLGDKSASS